MLQALCEVLDSRVTQALTIPRSPGVDAPETQSLLLEFWMSSSSSHPVLGTDAVNGQNPHQGKWSSWSKAKCNSVLRAHWSCCLTVRSIWEETPFSSHPKPLFFIHGGENHLETEVTNKGDWFLWQFLHISWLQEAPSKTVSGDLGRSWVRVWLWSKSKQAG